jgi:PAS domain S-box-containing protein
MTRSVHITTPRTIATASAGPMVALGPRDVAGSCDLFSELARFAIPRPEPFKPVPNGSQPPGPRTDDSHPDGSPHAGNHAGNHDRGFDGGIPACFSIDGGGRITDWTSAAERLVGWPAGRANGRRADDLLIAPSSLGSYHAELAVLENDGPTDGWLRVSVNHWDGRHMPVGLSLTRVAGDRSVNVHVAMRPGDISVLDSDHEHLLLHAVLASLGDGVDGAVVCDSSGHLIVITGVLEEIFGQAEGRAEDGAWATRVTALRHGDGRLMGRYAYPLVRALRGESFRESPLVIDPIDGPRRILLTTGHTLPGPTARGLGAIVTVCEVG